MAVMVKLVWNQMKHSVQHSYKAVLLQKVLWTVILDVIDKVDVKLVTSYPYRILLFVSFLSFHLGNFYFMFII